MYYNYLFITYRVVFADENLSTSLRDHDMLDSSSDSAYKIFHRLRAHTHVNLQIKINSS